MNEFKRMQKLAGIITEAQDVKPDVVETKKESTKTLRSKIKEMIIAELSSDEPEEDYEKESRKIEYGTQYDGPTPQDIQDEENDLDEAKEIVLPPKTDKKVEDTPSSGNLDSIQSALQTALEGARELGDTKLSDQIGNTITFFTREHIVNREITEENTFKQQYGRDLDIVDDEFDLPKNKERALEFIKKVNELVDEYHSDIYLMDDVFKAVEILNKLSLKIQKAGI